MFRQFGNVVSQVIRNRNQFVSIGKRNKHYYTKSHEFIDFIDDKRVRMGVSKYAIQSLGDIVYIEAEPVDTEFEEGDELTAIESVKATGSVNAICDGIIINTNTELIENPDNYENINNLEELDIWFFEFEPSSQIKKEELIKPENYDEYIESCK